jgi:hypothetical protein
MAKIYTLSVPDSRAHLFDRLDAYMNNRRQMGDRLTKSSTMVDALEFFLDSHELPEPADPLDVFEQQPQYEYTPEEAEIRDRVLQRSGPSPDAPPVRSEARGEVD